MKSYFSPANFFTAYLFLIKLDGAVFVVSIISSQFKTFPRIKIKKIRNCIFYTQHTTFYFQSWLTLLQLR